MLDLAQRLLGALGGGAVRAEPVLNWGGFLTHSFRVSGDGPPLHVKLATDHDGMRRWFEFREHLQRHYHAPPVLRWIDIPGTGYAGLVLPSIAGDTWEPLERPAVLAGIFHVLERLHADQEIVRRLPGHRTCLDAWESRYRERMTEDLAAVRRAPPPFVSSARLDWLEHESRSVLALAAEEPAFARPAASACHRDVWSGNILVEPSGRWWFLDWDDLDIGDPVEDYVALLWELAFWGKLEWREVLPREPEPEFAVRMDLHMRAATLDFAIDVLADWVECAASPWVDTVRSRKREEHAAYLDWYRSRWG